MWSQQLMASSGLLCFLCLIIIHLSLTTAQPTYNSVNCLDSGNYTANSAFQTNLNLILSSLVANSASGRGFYNTSTGQSPDTAYGLFQCRIDLSPELCQSCIKNSSETIVSMILQEVLRLYPPITALFRYTLQRTSIGGISIPAGVDIFIRTLLLQYDPEYWGDDAEEFKPERLAEGVSKASKDQIAFYPFGWGPRICLGQNFAMIEAKMALALVLQHFSFELSPSYTHAPYTVITLQPQHEAPIILHPI